MESSSSRSSTETSRSIWRKSKLTRAAWLRFVTRCDVRRQNIFKCNRQRIGKTQTKQTNEDNKTMGRFINRSSSSRSIDGRRCFIGERRREGNDSNEGDEANESN